VSTTDITQVGSADRGSVAPVLEVEGLRVFYGNIEAVKGVSIKVHPGEIVTLIGSNGAGKSTTLRAISGLNAPRHGTITFQGKADPGPSGTRDRLARHRSEPGGAEDLRTHERAGEPGARRLPAHRQGGIKDDVARVFDLFPRLKERITQRAGTMSGGEQQMLAMGAR
jgi:branched-chain amino acid transport system ATP-binding protein